MKKLIKGQYSGNKVNEILHKDFSCSLTTYNKFSFDSSRHYHPNAHISFVLKGGSEEVKEKEYLRTPGKTTFYDPEEVHQVRNMYKDSIHINIDFENSFFNENLQINDIRYACQHDPETALVMIKLYNELVYRDNVSETGIESLLFTLFERNHSVKKYTERPLWVKKTEEYIQENWNKPVSLDELSTVASVHKVTISRFFIKFFGCTLSEYIRKLRIQKSLYLMESSTVPLTEIALECGFSDQSHFIRNFKFYTGQLPKKFKSI